MLGWEQKNKKIPLSPKHESDLTNVCSVCIPCATDSVDRTLRSAGPGVEYYMQLFLQFEPAQLQISHLPRS
jgi:hypothetical protein